MKKWIWWVVATVVLLGGGTWSLVLFLHSMTHESTDDAYVAGTIVPIAAEVRGKVTRVFIDDNQYVRTGQALVEISKDDYANAFQEKSNTVSRLIAEDRELALSIEQKEKALVQSRAMLEAAVVDENLSLKEVKRYESLFKRQVVSASQYDRIESQWKVTVARRRAAEAAVDEADAAIKALQARAASQKFKIDEAKTAMKTAELDLTRTVVTAPIDGRITVKKVDPGKYVQPGQSLCTIVKEETWVIANFKETQIKKMAVEQPVQIKVDAYPGQVFKGRIDSLQSGTGSVFSLLPPENATGNFVKVVQRIPVKITIESPFDPAHPLWPGLSVVPVVDVSRTTGLKLARK
jgi:membrane fusion protein (multidrug efflux system)